VVDMTHGPTVAVLGCGYWGKNLVRNFNALGALRGIADESPEGRSTASTIAPRALLYTDAESILRSDVDGIVIATPAITHYQLASRALYAGKDVFVEKPLALNVDDGERLVELAARNDRILMVGHVLEYHPAILRMREQIKQGDLGNIQYLYSNLLSLGKIRREENILWSFAPHDVAIILRIVGGLPIEVVACGGSYIQPNIADMTVTHLLFDNGIRAHIHVSWLHPFKEQRLVVVGHRKMATFDDVRKRLVLYDQRVEIGAGAPIPISAEGEDVAFGADEPLRLECQAFLTAMATRETPITDGGSGVRVLRVLQAAQRSLIMNGEPVRLPMEAFESSSQRRWAASR
jgi:predicted dehydrogenase